MEWRPGQGVHKVVAAVAADHDAGGVILLGDRLEFVRDFPAPGFEPPWDSVHPERFDAR